LFAFYGDSLAGKKENPLGVPSTITRSAATPSVYQYGHAVGEPSIAQPRIREAGIQLRFRAQSSSAGDQIRSQLEYRKRNALEQQENTLRIESPQCAVYGATDRARVTQLSGVELAKQSLDPSRTNTTGGIHQVLCPRHSTDLTQSASNLVAECSDEKSSRRTRRVTGHPNPPRIRYRNAQSGKSRRGHPSPADPSRQVISR